MFCGLPIIGVGIIALSYIQRISQFQEVLANRIETTAVVVRKYGRYRIVVEYRDYEGKMYRRDFEVLLLNIIVSHKVKLLVSSTLRGVRISLPSKKLSNKHAQQPNPGVNLLHPRTYFIIKVVLSRSNNYLRCHHALNRLP